MPQDQIKGKVKDGELLPNDDVTVYATEKYRFAPVGSEVTVHSNLAKKLIESKKATAEPVKKA